MPSPPDSLIQLPSHSLSRSSFCGSARPMRQSVCRLSRGFGFSSLPSHNRSLQPRIMLCCSLPSHQQLSWAKPRLAALSASTGDGHNHAIHRNAPWNDILGGALRQVAQTKQTNRLLHQWKRTVGRGSGLAILKARAARCHCFHGSVCYFTRTWAVKHRRLSGASALHSVGCWTPKVGILCRRSTVLSRALPSDQRTEDQAESEANSNSSANTSSSNGTPGTGNDGKSPHGRDEEDPKQEPWRPWGWLSRILIAISMSQPFRVILNLVLVFFLVRLWPIGNREATAENAQSVVVVVPFSEFMQQVYTPQLVAACDWANASHADSAWFTSRCIVWI